MVNMGSFIGEGRRCVTLGVKWYLEQFISPENVKSNTSASVGYGSKTILLMTVIYVNILMYTSISRKGFIQGKIYQKMHASGGRVRVRVINETPCSSEVKLGLTGGSS